MKNDIAKLFQTLTHGVYVIGVTDREQSNAFTAAWVMQASFDPLLLVLSINPLHSSYGLLKQSGFFTVNVLSDTQMELAERFGRPGIADRLKGINWIQKSSGAPILCDALSYFECEVSHESAAGDHVLVIGRVIDGDLLNPAKTPMNYRDTGEMDGSSRLYPERL